MPRYFRSTRQLAGAVALTCFGAGIAGAYGAHAIETRVAVSDARTAAAQVESKREALEGSLTQAHSAIHDAQAVADEQQVAAAARALSLATHAATESAALSGVLVDVAPLDPDEIAALATDPALLDLAPATADGAEPVETAAPHESDEPDGAAEAVDNTVAPGSPSPEADDADSSEESDDATPAGQASPPAAQPSPHPVPSSAGRTDVVTDLQIARVLAGDTDSADEARAAATRLERAADALDEALETVDGGSLALSTAALEASHADTLLVLDAAVEQAKETLTNSEGTVSAVGDRVAADGPFETVDAALAELESATATAALVDREDPERVSAELDDLLGAAAQVDTAMASLQATHERWVERENDGIDSRNAERIEEHDAAVAEARGAHAEANRDAVAERAAGWKGRPVGVTGTNGSLTSDSLCEVDFAPGHRLQCDAAQALEDANAAYVAENGHDLTMTDSYRSYSLQVRTRALKPTTAARPGTSNHGWGMAVDLDRPSAVWLAANGAEYGWVNPTWARPGGSRPEWWHLEYVATDVGTFQAPTETELEEHVTSAFESTAGADK